MKYIEALIGKAKSLELLKTKYQQAIKVINEVCVVYPEFAPGQVENVKLLLLSNKWDLSQEKCDELLEDFPNDILA